MMNSLYQTCLTFTSQNIGAGKVKRSRNILLVCLCLVTAAGFLFGNGAYLLGEKLLAIYSDDQEVINAGMIKLAIFCKPYFLCGIMDVTTGAIRGMGASLLPMIVSVMGICVPAVVTPTLPSLISARMVASSME